MIMRSSKSMLVRLYCQLVVTLLLALLIEEPSSRLVNGQLEAVGAVLSVVPVTSILATAGLVGVKLAALSRLLNILGYDRAYLAQNLGTGTAAAPIGLQTRYAYMFPYVPGLNISVKGEDSIGMPKGAGGEMVAGDGTKMVATGQSDQSSGAMGPGAVVTMNGPPRRKTYPAMSLPAEYESQQKPFRGAEALKSIFGKAGLQVHIPTVEQQQQLQQKFELPTQGKDQNNNYYSNNYQQLAEHSVGNMHHFSEATTNTNDNDPNRNDKQPQLSSHILQQQPTYQDQLSTTTNDQQQQQLQQQQPPPLTNANNNNYQIDGSQQPPLRHDTLSGVGGSLLSNRRPLHNSVVPSNVTPNRGGGPMEPSSPPLSPQQPPPPLTTMHSDGANHDAITATGLALATGDDQLANKPSSLNSHQNHQPNQPPTSSSSNSNQSPSGRDQAAAGTATQVNMPHPHYNTHFLVNQQQQQPPQSQLLPARPMVLPLPLPGPVIDLSAGDAAAGVLRGHLSAGGDTGTGGASGSGPPHANEVEPAMGDNNDMAGRPHSAGGGSLSSLHYGQHAVIPQRDLFAFMARQRWSGMNAGAALGLANSPGPQQAPLTMGHLSRPEPGGQGPGGQVTPAIQAIQLIPSASLASRPHNGGMTQPHQFFSSAAVPDSFKPARHPELISQQHNSLHYNPQLSSNQNKNLNLNNQNNQLQNQNQFNPHHQHHHPTVASQGAGFSPLPNEMTSTNFFPRPFDIDDSPTLIGDRSNELDRTQPNRRRRRRRRKRSPGSTPFASLPDPVLSSSGHHQQRTAPLQPAQPGSKLTPTNRGDGSQQRKQPAKSGQKQHTGRPAGATFGMPVSNINTLKKRRRRRQVRLFSLSNSQFLD